VEKAGAWKPAKNQKQVSTGFPHSLGNLAEGARFPLSHSADNGFCSLNQNKSQNQTQGGGLTAASLCFNKADNSCVNKTGQT